MIISPQISLLLVEVPSTVLRWTLAISDIYFLKFSKIGNLTGTDSNYSLFPFQLPPNATSLGSSSTWGIQAEGI